MAEEKKGPKYDLDKIVDELDPEKINEKVELSHRKARNKYQLKDVQSKDYSAFMKEVTSYIKHHNKEVYKSDLPDHIASGKAKAMLNAAFEERGGFLGAFKAAKEGNMSSVLDAISNVMEHEEREHYVQHVMGKIDPQDFDSHVGLMKQYISKYGQLLPKNLKTKSPEQLASKYDSMIRHHVNVVEQAKSSLKKYDAEYKAEKKKAA